MAEVTRQEFAEMCGINSNNLRAYISRKNVIPCGKDGKLIDTTNPINLAFKNKRKSANTAKQEYQGLVTSVPPNPNRRQSSGANTAGDDDDELPPPLDHAVMAMMGKSEKGDMGKWFLMKAKGDAELVSIRVEKETLLLDKAAGRLVPMELVGNVLKSHGKAIFNNFESAIENIATKYCQIMAGGDMELYTKIVAEGHKELSAAIKRAGTDAANDLDNILTMYTETRGNKL